MKTKILVTVLALMVVLGGMAPASFAAGKENTIQSFYYLKVDGKTVTAKSRVNQLSKDNGIQVTMVLPKQNKNGDWLAYGFTSREKANQFAEKDKKKQQRNISMLGSGACCTDFYEGKNKSGQYIYWRSGFTNLSSAWNDRISSLSTASSSNSYSTTLWEHTSTQGYGRGVYFRHSDWYGKTANMASDWNNVASAIEIK
ncbi:hypothetical protein SAMN05444972_10783 [Marininema halotolerans]|uniref:Peptidase inhibitor family I36 n=2 Tax=Marininema halotolerans TaxID=1155944 RepID=A0A1I6SHJ5_9BACL|nr:hypothetical protein SAMN05444972_10783 [Marininema halotolerans]